MFIKESLKVVQITNLTPTTFGSLFIQIHRAKTIVGIIYRPPSLILTIINQRILLYLRLLLCQCLILVGNYNINLLNHEIHTETRNFLNVLFSNSIIPLITKHTRYGEHSAILIDNILTNKICRSESKYLSGIILENIWDRLPVFYY